MQLDGLKSNGPIRPDKGAAQRKADPKADGKSFADILTKAKQAPKPAQPPNPSDGPVPAPFQPTRFPTGDAVAPETADPRPDAKAQASQEAAPSAQEYLETIRFRLKTGYYDNPKVDDALSDKLSGYFDEAAE
jgi:hypothetical protein